MSRLERLGVVTVLGGIVVGGYFLFQSPQLRELLSSRGQRPAASPRPVAVRPSPLRSSSPSRDSPPTSRPEKPPQEVAQPPEEPSQQREEPQPTVQNQIPNRQLASTLLQIMAARGLAYGVSLSVTDERIEINGETDSEESRAAILEIIEKGRESRKIVIQQFTVKAPHP